GERFGRKIGRITPSGDITEFQLSANFGLYGITVGPDGNIWFASNDSNQIGRISPTGSDEEIQASFTAFDAPTKGFGGLTVGPDGNLWFTANGNRIGQMSTEGVILAEYPIPTPNSGPNRIRTGPDGNIWFTEYDGNKIGRLYVRTPASQFLIT